MGGAVTGRSKGGSEERPSLGRHGSTTGRRVKSGEGTAGVKRGSEGWGVRGRRVAERRAKGGRVKGGSEARRRKGYASDG
jgi:hypothetical protein